MWFFLSKDSLFLGNSFLEEILGLYAFKSRVESIIGLIVFIKDL